MSTTTRHPLAEAVARVHSALDQVAETPTWSLSQSGTADLLTDLARAQSRFAELQARVLAHADTVAVQERSAAPSVAVWLANATITTKRDAVRQTRFAAALSRYDVLRGALGAGDLNLEQAQVVARALDELPDDLDAGVLAQAEAALVSLARVHDAKALRVLGRRILDVVAPEVGEAWEAEKLAEEEREADRTASFRMRDQGDGRTRGSFTIPTLAAEMLQKVLIAYASPRRDDRSGADAADPDDAGDTEQVRKPSRSRWGRAFVELVERLDPRDLPRSGGVNAAVVVTMTTATLSGALAAATLDTGSRISAGTARRLACQAGVLPAVLGGDSEILDLGRTRRFFSGPQRIAMTVRDGGCTALGCDAPAGMCDAHHEDLWSHDGLTDLGRGRLLCGHHHRRAHDPAYETRVVERNQVEFHRRT
ncbi:MAG: DUF222 domain-containing protein [Nocardioides marinisabuli]|uniref:HNH endonuclease signature motif containing protein n=1 Tax=Nocardioides marinisabuli TaxID=419476 RepID=UPI00321A6515